MNLAGLAQGVGCWKCRERKVKCDETKPECLACRKLGLSCTGYGAQYTWVEEGRSTNVAQGRHVLPCESTWRGYQILPSDLVDCLISLCDEPSKAGQMLDQRFLLSTSKITPHNPFSVFKPSSPLIPSVQDVEISEHVEFPLQLVLTRFPNWTGNEAFLFHHYVNHIAGMMMPYEHPKNPWKSQYPAAALTFDGSEDTPLASAMIAHAAFNVVRLREQDEIILRVGMKHYGKALRGIARSVGMGSAQLPVTMASIMTLMLAEIYNGPSRPWRHHFDGAWTFLKARLDSGSCFASNLDLAARQSLDILTILEKTTRAPRQGMRQIKQHVAGEAVLKESLKQSTLHDFGFTIGAPPAILDCITQVAEFQYDLQTAPGMTPESLFLKLQLSLGQCLDQHSTSINLSLLSADLGGKEKSPSEAVHQSYAFIHAAYIYTYRCLLNAPPHAVQHHVTKVLRHVSLFITSSCGNFSIWPAFIAAVEAFTEADVGATRAWLNHAISFGMGSRNAVKTVVEEVWRRRQAISDSSGVDPGLVVVDWRHVMQELDLDLLLI